MPQSLLPLTQTVTTERAISLVCIPDRFAAECELTKIKHEYQARFIRATIRKNRPGKEITCTLRYWINHTETLKLF